MSVKQQRSKRYRAIVASAGAAADSAQTHSLAEALRLMQKQASAKFDESVDLAVHLQLKKNESVRCVLTLPHRFGKTRRILVFAKGEHVRQAEEAGAENVGGSDLITKIKGGWLEFDVAIATPEMMKEVASLGPILGRRGLMPNPKVGTVTMDVAAAVKELAGGRREFRADKGGTVHASIGKVSMKHDQLLENSRTLLEAVRSQQPDGHKGRFVTGVYASSTMGVGMRVDLEDVGVQE